MSIDTNDEIIQDFLVEAGELLEQLDQQLVNLETSPDDMDLLNSVFRNFHTIKGGAGFLAIDSLVDVCHKAENVFDMLRRGERSVTADLMDAVLQAFDSVKLMFEQIREGEMPQDADPGLIGRLEIFSRPDDGSGEQVVSESATTAVELPSTAVEDDNKSKEVENSITASDSEEITEDEFEALLDQLHGKRVATTIAKPEQKENHPAPAARTDAGENNLDEEFEALLDQLQEQKKGAFAPPPADSESKPATSSESPVTTESPAPSSREKAGDYALVEPTAGGSEKKSANTDSTVRVETGTLDRIMNMVGELVLLRNRLINLGAEIGNEEMSTAVGNLDVVTADLQASVMKTRMQPIKKVFGRFPRVVRDVARSLKKDVLLKTTGEETDLDKNLVEALTDPLIHLVRNAVDHGIETPEVRIAAGKPRQGIIHLSAEQEGDHILLKISDDGAGMNAEVLRRKVVEKGLMDEDAAARLSDRDCYHLIFLPGLSTKEQVSDISGRGVGMDVVKSKINQLNGTILIDSAPGRGSVISIKVPLTLAIMPTLMVELGTLEQIFALPLVNVNEILDLDAHRINIVDGQRVMLVRGKPLPLFRLNRWLTNGGDDHDMAGHVVVVNVGTRHIGLLVDKLIGREEVVIKPLGALLQGTQGLTGATVTGNGKIALILDLPSLVQSYSHLRQ